MLFTKLGFIVYRVAPLKRMLNPEKQFQNMAVNYTKSVKKTGHAHKFAYTLLKWPRLK